MFVTSKQWVLSILCFLLVILLAGCAGYSTKSDFELVEGEKKITKGTIAVIAGSGSEIDIKLANEITTQLTDNTNLTVFSQEELSKRMPQYPMFFMKSQESETDQWSIRPSYLSEENKKSMKKIQEKLGAEYILLAWAEGVKYWQHDVTETCIFSFINGKKCKLSVPCRVLKYPENRVIASYNYKDYYSSSSLFSFNQVIDKFLVRASRQITEQFTTAILDESMIINTSEK
ncbi:MAG: hypothetical protein ACOCX9_03355 [Spirochaetota bacterium]